MLARNACLSTRRAGLCLLLAMGVCFLDVARATFSYFGGYEPLTNVTEHSKIYLDLINIMDNLGGTCGASCALKDCSATSVAADGTGCNYDGSTMAFPSGTTCQWGDNKELDGNSTCTATSNAYDIWLQGQNSEKSSAMRKISAFASGAATKGASASVLYRNKRYIAIMNYYTFFLKVLYVKINVMFCLEHGPSMSTPLSFIDS